MTKDYLGQMNRDIIQTETANKQNCTNPRSPPLMYNSSCAFVEAECSEEYELINYLAFVLCDLHRVQVCGIVVVLNECAWNVISFSPWDIQFLEYGCFFLSLYLQQQ